MNKDRYDGEWQRNMKDGKGNILQTLGIYYYANGDRYDGQWREGKREGKGFLPHHP